jgi:uncharacterized protein YggU (UPF0235/DUF167 family)
VVARTFTVRVTPRAGRDDVTGVGPDGELQVKVRAAPADGAANLAVLRTIAAAAGVAPSRLQLVRGATSRTKIVAIEGVMESELRARWPGLLTRPA